MPNNRATFCSTASSSARKSFFLSSTCTFMMFWSSAALRVPGSRFTMLLMNTRDSPGGSRSEYSMRSGSMGMRGWSARQATSVPPIRERTRKKGANLRHSYQTRCAGGSSATLAITASTTAGTPIHQDEAAPSVRIHQMRSSMPVRDTILIKPLVVIFTDALCPYFMRIAPPPRTICSLPVCRWYDGLPGKPCKRPIRDYPITSATGWPSRSGGRFPVPRWPPLPVLLPCYLSR